VNALRSLNRWVALALTDFEVRWAPQEGAFERPCATVTAAAPVSSTPHGKLYRDLAQPFAIVAFPTEGINPESCLLEAARVERLLLDAFTAGEHPMRVPLFDYADVPLREPATDDQHAGFMRVLDTPATNSFPDPNADTAYVVTCDVRLGWNESAAPRPSGPLTESVTATPVVP
jgi:hypothetical protein